MYTAEIRKRIAFRGAFKDRVEQWMIDLTPFMPTITPATRKLIQRFANKDEQSSPFYDVMLSDYPVETLALQIEAAHPDVNFAQIAKLYESREKRPWRVNFRVVITGVLGIGLFLLNTVPDVLLNKLWPIELPNGAKFAQFFDVLVFLSTSVLVLFIAGYWLYWWIEFGRWLRTLRHSVRDALDYLAIRQGRSIAQPDANADRS